MTLLSRFRRVSRTFPCPICGKPDWCLVSSDGGDHPIAAVCAREESPRRWGEAGWFHRLASEPRRRRRGFSRTVTGQGRDFGPLAERFRLDCTAARRDALARALGVSGSSLESLGLGWTGGAYSFPMSDGAGRTCGIRLRSPAGAKFAIRGSRQGLFLPGHLEHGGLLLVSEGPTDAAALMDLGFGVIGRPSCDSGMRQVVAVVRRQHPTRIVVLADGDSPGRRGAFRLAHALTVYAKDVRVVLPPEGVKDAREWVRAGATRADVERAVDDAPRPSAAVGAGR